MRVPLTALHPLIPLRIIRARKAEAYENINIKYLAIRVPTVHGSARVTPLNKSCLKKSILPGFLPGGVGSITPESFSDAYVGVSFMFQVIFIDF